MIDCPLWPYRMNTNPLRRTNLTEEQRAERGARLKRARAGGFTQNFREETGGEASEVVE